MNSTEALALLEDAVWAALDAGVDKDDVLYLVKTAIADAA